MSGLAAVQVIDSLVERVPHGAGRRWHARLVAGITLVLLVNLFLLGVLEAVVRGPLDYRAIAVFITVLVETFAVVALRISGAWRLAAIMSLTQMYVVLVALDLTGPNNEEAVAAALLVWACLAPVMLGRRAAAPAFALSVLGHFIGWTDLAAPTPDTWVSLGGTLLSGAVLSGGAWVMETAREAAHLKAQERAEAAESAAREAQRGNEAKSTFLAMMSHEIRTPMNGVLGMAHLLQLSSLDRDQRMMARTLEESGRSLLRVLNDVLDFSKMEAGHMEVERIAWRPARVLEQVVELLQQPAQAKGLQLGFEVERGVPEAVMGDPTRVRQVLLNLVGNALKFTEQGGVAVRGVVRGERLHLIVEDTGIGIPEEVQPRLFEAFIQADSSTTRRFGGTGLGLAISHRLCVLMGGSLDLTSTEGHGSTFVVDLPLERASGGGEPPPQSPLTVGALVDLRVLVAEDNAVNRMLIERLLQRLGVEATVIEDGSGCVEHLRHHPTEIVLMDLDMPVMDGFAATAAIRAMEGRVAEVPVIALTASALVQDRQRCLDAGMDDHITKPIDPSELERTLLRWVKKRARVAV